MKSIQNKFIYISIPKTGSVSIKRTFQLFRDHLINGTSASQKTALQAKKIFSDEEWSEYFKFTVVRNPWERIWSNFCVRVQRLETYLDSHRREQYFSKTQASMKAAGQSDDTFLEWQIQMEKNMENIARFFDNWGSYEAAFKKIVYDHEPQSDYYTDEYGNVILDYLMDFDNFEKDFSYVCGKLNINAQSKLRHDNKLNYNSLDLDYHKFYTQELIDMVLAKDHQTIKIKNYTFK